MPLSNKTALVTGAAQGIGRGIALRLAKDGANIVLTDINPDKLKDVVAEVEALGRKALAITTDVGQRDQVYNAVEQAQKTMGQLDIMVNNAGIAQRSEERV